MNRSYKHLYRPVQISMSALISNGIWPLYVEGSGFPRCTQHNVHVRLFLYHLLLMTSTPNARIDIPHFSIRPEL